MNKKVEAVVEYLGLVRRGSRWYQYAAETRAWHPVSSAALHSLARRGVEEYSRWAQEEGYAPPVSARLARRLAGDQQPIKYWGCLSLEALPGGLVFAAGALGAAQHIEYAYAEGPRGRRYRRRTDRTEPGWPVTYQVLHSR